jgi:hypothetical protein
LAQNGQDSRQVHALLGFLYQLAAIAAARQSQPESLFDV